MQQRVNYIVFMLAVGFTKLVQVNPYKMGGGSGSKTDPYLPQRSNSARLDRNPASDCFRADGVPAVVALEDAKSRESWARSITVAHQLSSRSDMSSPECLSARSLEPSWRSIYLPVKRLHTSCYIYCKDFTASALRLRKDGPPDFQLKVLQEKLRDKRIFPIPCVSLQLKENKSVPCYSTHDGNRIVSYWAYLPTFIEFF